LLGKAPKGWLSSALRRRALAAGASGMRKSLH